MMNATSWSKESKIRHRNSLEQHPRSCASASLTTLSALETPEWMKLSNASKKKPSGVSQGSCRWNGQFCSFFTLSELGQECCTEKNMKTRVTHPSRGV